MMKKYTVVLLGVLMFLMIPFDAFLNDIPKPLIWVCILFLAFSNYLLWRDKSKKKPTKIIMTSLGGLVTLLLIADMYFSPYFNSINFRVSTNFNAIDYRDTVSAKEAMEDLEFTVKKVKKIHPALKMGLTDEMQVKYEQAKAEINSRDYFTPEQLARIIEPVLSVLHDGHTLINAYFSTWHNYYLFYDNDSLNLVGINGQSMDEFFEAKSYLVSYDHPAFGKLNVLNLITCLEGLEYYGVDVSNGVVYNFTDLEGNPVDITAYEDEFITYAEYLEQNPTETNSPSSDTEYEFASYEIDTDNNLAFFTLDSCEYNLKYINMVREFFEEVKEKKITNVCFDLRNNGGGNSLVANEVIKYLDVDTYNEITCTARFGPLLIDLGKPQKENKKVTDLTFTGDLYLLTSTNSFSSAMDFAMYVKDNRLGTIIGEEPGNDPNGYGDVAEFMTPNANLYFQVSYKKWNRIDINATDKYIVPDIPCDSRDAYDILLETIN